jgi:hypothetical protein
VRKAPAVQLVVLNLHRKQMNYYAQAKAAHLFDNMLGHQELLSHERIFQLIEKVPASQGRIGRRGLKGN